MRIDAVHADAQDLGIELLESGEVLLKRDQLDSSRIGEIEDVKGQHDDFAPQLRQAERAGAKAGG
jgi:hypothetical protein